MINPLALCFCFVLNQDTPKFELVPDAFGGPSYKIRCEGVDVADLDLDGKLDVIFATGFVLRSVKMEAHIPQLQMNRGDGPGKWKFVDEAAERLPKDFVVQAGGVLAWDFGGDGAPDLLFAQMASKSGGRPTAYLVNDGQGKFTDLTGKSFPATLMSSAGGEAGDLDADGDLDVILCDQGKVSRLFLNDGKGNFTEALDRLPALVLPVAQDVTLADIDGDFDLDLIGTFKGKTGQPLFLNDGAATFTDATKAFGYLGSENNYEVEFGDLDDDGDVDGVWVSYEGYTDGTAKNLFAQSGKIGFEHGKDAISGHNGDDDNEISLVDADNDGKMDFIVASLAYKSPKLYMNRGGFKFEFVDAFTAKPAPGCDGIAADLDGDRRADYVHCIGEAAAGNLLFAGKGPEDKRAPKIIATSVQKRGDSTLIIAFVQDAFYDDGKDLLYCWLESPGGARDKQIRMSPMGGHLFRALVKEPLETLRLHARDSAGNTTAPTSVLSAASRPAPK